MPLLRRRAEALFQAPAASRVERGVAPQNAGMPGASRLAAKTPCQPSAPHHSVRIVESLALRGFRGLYKDFPEKII
jgi:hypothetical protein